MRFIVRVAPLATVTIRAMVGAVPKEPSPVSMVNVPLPLKIVEPVPLMVPPVQLRELRVNVLVPFMVPEENV